MLKFEEKTLETREVFDGNILKLRVDEIELPDGRRSTREIVEHSGGVAILPVTAKGEIVLVKQYRKPAENVLLELPAGKLEPGEKPEECARRELIEETGYEVGSVKEMCSFYTSPGYSDEIIYLYLGLELTETERNPDTDELIEVVKINKDDFINMIDKGQIVDSKTLIGFLSYLRSDV